jgi:hypothetical protein
VDGRFPTLDDGEVLLKILSAYSPILQEGHFVLWKRNPPGGDSYSLVNKRDFIVSPDEWFSITNEPTWCRLEMRETSFGIIANLLWSSCNVRIEVQLEDGKRLDYRLLPGNARYGFLLNPLLEKDAGLLRPPASHLAPPRVLAARVRVGSDRMFNRSIHVGMLTVRGVPKLQPAPAAARLDSKSDEN